LLAVFLAILVLVVPHPEGLERLDVGDLVQDGPEVLDDVGTQALDVLLRKIKTLSINGARDCRGW